MRQKTTGGRARVFISHSSEDLELANAIRSLLGIAVNDLSIDSIVCTTAAPLEGGVRISEALRNHIFGSDVVLGLLTPRSMESHYVSFELGAAWGTPDIKVIPLLGPCVQPDDIYEPLRELQALSCGSPRDLHQLLQTTADRVGSSVQEPHQYDQYLQAVLDLYSRQRYRARDADGSQETVGVDVVARRVNPVLSERALKHTRAFENDVLKLISQKTAITGDQATTSRIVMGSHITCFIQGSESLVKVQSFGLPQGAHQVRGRSNQDDDGGNSHIATTWAFIRHNAGIRLLTRDGRGTRAHWCIPDGLDGGTFLLVAVYHGVQIGILDYAGVEVADLAGRIRNLELIIGGQISDLRFNDVYYLKSDTLPLEFRPCGRMVTLTNPKARISGALSETLRELDDQSIDTDLWKEAMDICSEAVSRGTAWKFWGISLEDATDDVVAGLALSYE